MFRPMRDLNDRNERVMILLEGGRERQGYWDQASQRWRSAIDPRVTLRPVAWREFPRRGANRAAG